MGHAACRKPQEAWFRIKRKLIRSLYAVYDMYVKTNSLCSTLNSSSERGCKALWIRYQVALAACDTCTYKTSACNKDLLVLLLLRKQIELLHVIEEATSISQTTVSGRALQDLLTPRAFLANASNGPAHRCFMNFSATCASKTRVEDALHILRPGPNLC